mmetsp:Transcript_142421/g.346096  ORF Transcript_142421/g.346096 Transcript_142421/m.346096 type:complete len:125 (+) Transcript_142421:1015-1389(+)
MDCTCMTIVCGRKLHSFKVWQTLVVLVLVHQAVYIVVMMQGGYTHLTHAMRLRWAMIYCTDNTPCPLPGSRIEFHLETSWEPYTEYAVMIEVHLPQCLPSSEVHSQLMFFWSLQQAQLQLVLVR